MRVQINSQSNLLLTNSKMDSKISTNISRVNGALSRYQFQYLGQLSYKSATSYNAYDRYYRNGGLVICLEVINYEDGTGECINDIRFISKVNNAGRYFENFINFDLGGSMPSRTDSTYYQDTRFSSTNTLGQLEDIIGFQLLVCDDAYNFDSEEHICYTAPLTSSHGSMLPISTILKELTK